MGKRVLKRYAVPEQMDLDSAMFWPFAHAKRREKDAKADQSEWAPPIKEWLKDRQQKSKRIRYDEAEDATISLKERDNSFVDGERLKKRIGAKAYAKLTTPVLDMEKVEAAIALGELDANIVAECLENTKKTEYLECRFSKAKSR